MPKFYFHIRNYDRIEDLEGEEHPTVGAAHGEAIIALRQIIAERVREGDPIDAGSIEICDEAGVLLDTVNFADVVSYR